MMDLVSVPRRELVELLKLSELGISELGRKIKMLEHLQHDVLELKAEYKSSIAAVADIRRLLEKDLPPR